MKTKLHNIVSSIVLADAMRKLKNEFMISIRGYLRPSDEDDNLFIRAEHAARDAMEVTLMERDHKYNCPYCKSENLDFSAGNGGDEKNNSEGVSHLFYTAICKDCGKKAYQAYRYLGILTEGQFNSLLEK